MKILAIDSTACPASVAISENGNIVGEFFINTKLTHSTTLMDMCNSLLKNTQTDISTIDAFAVNAGPGSFTGVRIGVSAIKGMAWTLNKPCVSISTLECIAQNLSGMDCIACSVMDARCNQFYNALFDCNSNGIISRLCDDRAISYAELISDLSKYTDKKIILCGDGSDLAFELLKSDIPNLEVAQTYLKYQKAFSTAILAEKEVQSNNTLNANQLMPIYLRLPQAQRELKKKQTERNEVK